MADLAQLEEQIVSLSLLEAAALVKKLEERLGVSAAAAPPPPATITGAAAAADTPRRSSSFFTRAAASSSDRPTIESSNCCKSAIVFSNFLRPGEPRLYVIDLSTFAIVGPGFQCDWASSERQTTLSIWPRNP